MRNQKVTVRLIGAAALFLSVVCHANSDLKYSSVASIAHAINFAASKSVTKDSLDRCIQEVLSSNKNSFRPGALREFANSGGIGSAYSDRQAKNAETNYRNTLRIEFGGGAHAICFAELMIYLEYQHYPTYKILETLRSSQSQSGRGWNQDEVDTFESNRTDAFWVNLAQKIDMNSSFIWSLVPSFGMGVQRWMGPDRNDPLHLKCYDSQGNAAICRYCGKDYFYFCQGGDLGDFRSTVRSELDGIANQNGQQYSNYPKVYRNALVIMYDTWRETFVSWENGTREKVQSEVSQEVFTYLDEEMRALRERFACSASWESSAFYRVVNEEPSFSLMNTDLDSYKLEPACEV